MTDSGASSGEIRKPPQTASAPLTANVVACADAGGEPEGGSNPTWEHCIGNPSFEGPVTPTQFESFQAPPWNACYAGGFITYSAIADPTLWPQQNWTFPTASDGSTYLALGLQTILSGRTSQTLCEPIAAGATRSFLVDLARATSASPATEAPTQQIQVLGGTTECQETEVLGRPHRSPFRGQPTA